MTITPAKLEANRLNAKKSTGPRTAKGKRRSRMNATSDQLFCNDLVLRCENKELFRTFRESFLFELRPTDFVELMLVDRIVIAAWKLKRLSRIESALTDLYTGQINVAAREVLDDMKDEEQARKEVSENDRFSTERAPQERTEAERAKVERCRLEMTSLLDEENVHVADAQARAFFERDSRAFDRVERHRNWLEVSIHRSLRDLEIFRKRTQRNGAIFRAKAYYPPELTRERIAELVEENRENEPKESAGEN